MYAVKVDSQHPVKVRPWLAMTWGGHAAVGQAIATPVTSRRTSVDARTLKLTGGLIAAVVERFDVMNRTDRVAAWTNRPTMQGGVVQEGQHVVGQVDAQDATTTRRIVSSTGIKQQSPATPHLFQHADEVGVELGHACSLVVVRQELHTNGFLERLEHRQILLVRRDVHHFVIFEVVLPKRKKRRGRQGHSS